MPGFRSCRAFSKLTWDNVAMLSPRYRREFDLKNEDVVELTTWTHERTAPVRVPPGQPDEVTVALGYGRRRWCRAG